MKRVSLLPSIFILALLALLLSLGNWQLNRAEEKRDIESKIIAAQTDKPIHISSLEQSVDREFYKITLEGYFDDKRNIIDTIISNLFLDFFHTIYNIIF